VFDQMYTFIIVATVEQAIVQLNKLRKAVGIVGTAYLVDGKVYSAVELIALANSVVTTTHS
jgi:hypothetical protein